jgi:hypothetical protein
VADEFVTIIQQVRPARWLFVVAPGDGEQLRRVVSLSSSTWDGLRSGILPDYRRLPGPGVQSMRRCAAQMSTVDAATVFERLPRTLARGPRRPRRPHRRGARDRQLPLDDDEKAALLGVGDHARRSRDAPPPPTARRHMSTSSDHPRRPASRSMRPPGLARALHDELGKLRGRILGNCAACGHTMYFEHNVTPLNGRLVHVLARSPHPRPQRRARPTHGT